MHGFSQSLKIGTRSASQRFVMKIPNLEEVITHFWRHLRYFCRNSENTFSKERLPLRFEETLAALHHNKANTQQENRDQHQ